MSMSPLKNALLSLTLLMGAAPSTWNTVGPDLPYVD